MDPITIDYLIQRIDKVPEKFRDLYNNDNFILVNTLNAGMGHFHAICMLKNYAFSNKIFFSILLGGSDENATIDNKNRYLKLKTEDITYMQYLECFDKIAKFGPLP